MNATTGVVTYSGDANFSGSDEFTYTVNDDSGSTSNLATVAIIVNSVNDAPTFIGDGSGSVLKGGGYTITTADLFYLDPDSEDGDADVTFTASALILVSFLLLPWFLFWPSLLFGLLLLFRLSRAIQGISLRG